MKIQAKLLIPIYSCILVSFLVIWLSTYLIVYQNNLQNGFDHLDTRNQLKENQVNNFLGEITEKLSEFSSSEENIQAVKSLSKFQRSKNTPQYKDALQVLQNNIIHFQEIYPEIQDIIFADVFGITVYSLSSEKNIGKFIEQKYGKWFLKRSQESVFISDIRLKDTTDSESSFIFASKPIKENTGIIWSLIIEMNSGGLDAILSLASGLWDTWETYIVWRDGIIKTDRRNFNFMKFSTQINSYIYEWCFWSDISEGASKKYTNIIGKEVIGKYKYISEIDMCLITEIYLDEVLSTAKSILLIFIFWSAMVFLCISWLIRIFVKNITSRLLYLTEKMEQVSKGNKNIFLDIDSKDEIWNLAESFQGMISELRITDEKIQKKVHAQTKEIKSKQKETEALNKELLKFQEALKKASDYIAILDAKWRIVYLNTSMEQETWYQLNECKWKHPYDVWRRQEEKDKVENIWEKVADTKAAVAIDMFTTRKDGSHFISEVHISPILNKAWEIIFYLTIENDITQETAVKKMKDDFISLVSHELRTPMTVIKWFSKILLDGTSGKLNTDQKWYINRIYSNVNYLIGMVNDMLDIEKLNSGKMTFKYEDFDIYMLIQDIGQELKDMCQDKNIRMKISGKKQILHSDHSKIKQVLINLIRNAYKFTPEDGNIHIRVSKKKHHIKVEVIDTGIGIKKKDFWKIFEKFGQVDWPLQKQHEWTWLGLNICKLIIEKLEWEIGFSSEYEVWSTFYFTLPL